MDEQHQAMKRWGQAIDAAVDAGDAEVAIQACRELIRRVPDVVRTRYTLVCLLAAQNRFAEAAAALEDYQRAVLRTATRVYAVPRLVLLASVVDDPTLRESIGNALLRLEAWLDAEHVISHARAAATGLWPGHGSRASHEQIFRLARV